MNVGLLRFFDDSLNTFKDLCLIAEQNLTFNGDPILVLDQKSRAGSGFNLGPGKGPSLGRLWDPERVRL